MTEHLDPSKSPSDYPITPNNSTMDVRKQLQDPQSAGSRGLANLAMHKLSPNNPIRQYIKTENPWNKK
jgi:hypothetical protein